MKKFKNQKEMWESISKEISSNFDIVVTGDQCNNRFKRIKRTATEALDHNRKSGNNPRVVHFDDQLQKIKSLDDSFMPKVRFGIGISEVSEESTNKEKENDFDDEDDDARYKKRRTQKKSSKQSMADVIKETMELKERNKMKRHEDKMQLWKKYFDDMISKKNS